MSKRDEAPRKVVEVNRAPVLTLWGTVVAGRLGYDHDAALTLGKAVAGLNAQSKGRRLGIYEPAEKPEKAKRERQGGAEWVEVLGRQVAVARTDKGLRAVVGGKPVGPASVEAYLRRGFGDDLGAVREAMATLARAYPPRELERAAYGLYEQFRPAVPAGKRGWGAKGRLDLELIRSLGKKG